MQPLDFDCIVLGNEPAGLWLLQQYSQRAKNSPKSKIAKSLTEPIKLAWLPLGPAPSPIKLPLPVAEFYRLRTNPTPNPEFSAEVVTPKKVFSWDTAHIHQKFPEISENFSETLHRNLRFPSHTEASSLRAALSAHPELLDIGNALWKRIGRSEESTGETLVWNSLLCHRFSFWDAQLSIQEHPEIETIPIGSNEINSVEQNKDGRLHIRFEGGLKLTAKTFILNSSVRRLTRLCKSNSSLLDWSYSPDQTLSDFALYPIQLKLAPGVLPLSLRPLTLAMKNDLLPEPDSEIWPLEFIRNTGLENALVKLWVTDRYHFSLENLLEKFRTGLAHFYKIFPKSIKEINHYSVPLNMDSCYSESQRNHHLLELENEGIEKYRLTRSMVNTQIKSLYTLMPYLNCSYPYPLGTLMAAESLLKELFGKNLESR